MVLRAAMVIAALRLTVLWSGIFLWDNADWRQVVGYILLVLDCVFEMTLARPWLKNRTAWGPILSIFVAASSVGLVVFGRRLFAA
jgi:hypothetical protein